ncbi:terminase [Cellulomonas hominis]|uniref:terminase n=1 Tax=Cellulomonas hominis TaxID=156981 RepID=UPI0014441F6E|nr:terminase [Cellulomonas hominis]NKY08934.1 terminase [Cellulomonas hominis]
MKAKCAEWGDSFDLWQDGAGTVILGKDADDMYAATVGGVTISIPRQVAKTFLIGRIIFALCALFPGMRVLWTAHHTATLSNTFRSLAGFARRKKVAPYIAHVRRGSGKESIEFTNGSVIFFGARSQGFGRGFDEVDVEVFDEAQILDEKALEDMVAATNQSRHPHGALLFYMGTPPRPTDPGEAFTSRRDEHLDGKPAGAVVMERGNAVYIETSADENVGRPGGPGLDDPAQISKANPSYPHRTPPVSVARLRANLKSDDAWRREGLGVWDEKVSAKRAITAAEWDALGVTEPPMDGTPSFGVAFSADGTRVSVSGAMKHDEGVHVELVGAHSGPTDSGVGPLADWLTERWRKTATIVISGRAGADVLAEALRSRGVSKRCIHVASSAEYFTACGMLLDTVRAARVAAAELPGTPPPLTHLATAGQKALDDSIAVCNKKARGTSGSWGWQATTDDGDETPTEAISLALWGARTTKRRPGRKAEVL